MTHEAEIQYWSKHPDGTKVWLKSSKDTEWQITYLPRWGSDTIYIVDDEWSELRKAQADGKQLQTKLTNKWEDAELTIDVLDVLAVSDWRIKPEPIYEYQWIYKRDDGRFSFSAMFYTYEEAKKDSIFIEPYKPSKRIRNG